jgi:hypothetical protein
MFTAIMEIFALIAHLLSTSVRVAGPGGVRAVIAESLLLKHQLIVLNRARNRAPRLTAWDRRVPSGKCIRDTRCPTGLAARARLLPH